MKKFIIDRTDNSLLLNCILPVIKTEGEYLTLEYKDFDGSTKTVTVHETDGEFYDESVSLRRKKDLAIRNVFSLMEYNQITLEDLQNYK
jgi:hypothetical protein